MRQWSVPDFSAYESVHRVLNEVRASDGRALPVGARTRVYDALDKLRFGCAPNRDITVAECVALAIHELEWAIRKGRQQDEAFIRDNLAILVRLWEESLPRLQAYSSIFEVLEEVCFRSGSIFSSSLSSRVFSAVDTLRACAVPQEDIKLAERIGLSLHKLETAIRLGDVEEEALTRTELLFLADNWTNPALLQWKVTGFAAAGSEDSKEAQWDDEEVPLPWLN